MTLRAAVAAALILAISAICDAPAFAGDALGRSLDGRLVADACNQLWECDGNGGVKQLRYGFDEYKKRLRAERGS